MRSVSSDVHVTDLHAEGAGSFAPSTRATSPAAAAYIMAAIMEGDKEHDEGSTVSANAADGGGAAVSPSDVLIDVNLPLAPQLLKLGLDVEKASGAINAAIRELLAGPRAAPAAVVQSAQVSQQGVDKSLDDARLRTPTEIDRILTKADALAASVNKNAPPPSPSSSSSLPSPAASSSSLPSPASSSETKSGSESDRKTAVSSSVDVKASFPPSPSGETKTPELSTSSDLPTPAASPLPRRESSIRKPPPPPERLDSARSESMELPEPETPRHRGSVIEGRGSVISSAGDLTPRQYTTAALFNQGNSALTLNVDVDAADDEPGNEPSMSEDYSQENDVARPSLSVTMSDRQRSPSTRNDNLTKRERVIQEFVSTEDSYAKSLNLLLTTYVIPVKIQQHDPSFGVSDNELGLLLSNLEALVEFHSSFSEKLKAAEVSLTQLILESPIEGMYTEYLNGYSDMVATLNAERKDNKKFTAFYETMIEDINKSSGGAGLDLVSYLIMPVQRVPRYVMLLKELIRSTDPSHPEFTALGDSLLKMEGAANSMNEGKRRRENELKIEDLQARIGGEVELAGKTFLREDLVQLKGGGMLGGDSKMRIFLFSDLLCWTTENYKFKGQKGLAATTFVADNGEFGEKAGIEVTTNSDCFVFFLQNGGEEAWLEDANRAKKEAKAAREAKMKSKTLKISKSAASSEYNAEMAQAFSSLSKGGTLGSEKSRPVMTRRQLLKSKDAKPTADSIDSRLLNGEVGADSRSGSVIAPSPSKRSLSLTRGPRLSTSHE